MLPQLNAAQPAARGCKTGERHLCVRAGESPSYDFPGSHPRFSAFSRNSGQEQTFDIPRIHPERTVFKCQIKVLEDPAEGAAEAEFSRRRSAAVPIVPLRWRLLYVLVELSVAPKVLEDPSRVVAGVPRLIRARCPDCSRMGRSLSVSGQQSCGRVRGLMMLFGLLDITV